jgi:hypothetical protein
VAVGVGVGGGSRAVAAWIRIQAQMRLREEKKKRHFFNAKVMCHRSVCGEIAKMSRPIEILQIQRLASIGSSTTSKHKRLIDKYQIVFCCEIQCMSMSYHRKLLHTSG